MKIAVIIPAHNEADRIGPVLANIPKTVKNHPVEVVVVDDGSKDKTCQIARSFDRVKVIKHRVNLGKGAAVKTGCEAACKLGADILVLMDGDGQHRPEDIARMVTPLIKSQEPMMIIGCRKPSKTMPLSIRIGNLTLTFLTKSLFGVSVSDSQSGFRAFRCRNYPDIKWRASNYAMETEMLILGALQNLRFKEVGIETIYFDNYKGTTVFDWLRIVKYLLTWRLSWLREYRSSESYSA